MKLVVAGPGDKVCLDGAEYRVNGRLIGTVRVADSLGRRLEPYRFCGDVAPGEAYVATAVPGGVSLVAVMPKDRRAWA